MSLFDNIRKLKMAADAGGNYGFIAQNMACIYHIIGQTDFGKSLNEEQRLYTTGFLDAMPYILAGQIDCEELQREVLTAEVGRLGQLNACRIHRESFSHEENQNLVAYVMCVELLIFEQENPQHIPYTAIVDSIISQKPLIADMVNKTLKEGNSCPLYKDVLSRGILQALNDKSFQEMILEYKGIEGN